MARGRLVGMPGAMDSGGLEIGYLGSAAGSERLAAVVTPKLQTRPVFSASQISIWLAVLVALAALEVTMRSLVAGYPSRPLPLVSFRPDRVPTGEISEYRQCSEGWTSTHFWRDGSRVTGNAWLEPASMGVIVGDSFSEAYQVSDTAVAASQVERLARQAGKALNVRQYGWSGTSVPVYVALAPAILSRLSPAWVAVLLNVSDLGASGLSDSLYWQGQIGPDHELTLTEISETQRRAQHSAVWRATRAVMERSILAYYVINKFKEILDPQQGDAERNGIDSPADRFATLAEVRALKRVYGSRLLIVYTPRIHVSPESDTVIEEQGLLNACESEAVRCVSMRQAMIEARDRQHTMCTGFANTLPGDGHLNAHGHRVLADLIWANTRDLTEPR